MSTPASRAPRLRLALQPLLVKLYKLVGIGALAIILVGLIFYVIVNLFYFLDHTWVRPVILSPRHDKVAQATHELTAAQERLATLEVERARTTAELARIDRVIAASQAFEADLRPAIEAAGHTLAAASARRELDRAVLERQDAADDKAAAELSARTLDAQIAEQKAMIGRLETSYYLKAREHDVVVGFVPYENLPNARPGTTLYRSTILAGGVRTTRPPTALMGAYQRRGIFSNRHDDLASLRTTLHEHLEDVTVRVVGCVALFAGRF